MGRLGRSRLAASRSSPGHHRDLLPRLLGRGGGGDARDTGRNREVAYLLRAQGTQACAARTRAGAMTEWTCAEARISLGVYVLGAIDPSERGLVDAHLATCRDCRDELAGMAGLPALLARVNPDEVSRICADDT